MAYGAGAYGLAQWIATAAAVGGAVTQGVQGQQAANRGKQQLKRQKETQDQAQAAAISQKRDNDIAQRRANRKKPDIAAILAANQGGGGVGGTSLTGPGGIDTTSLALGQNIRLGQ